MNHLTQSPPRQNAGIYKGLRELNLDPHSWWWLCLAKNGDSYLFSSLAEAFIDTHGEKSGITIITNGSKDIPRLFSPFIKDVVSHPEIFWDSVWALEDWGDIKPGYPIMPHPSLYGDGRLTSFESHPSASITFLDLTKYVLKLPWTAVPSKPTILDEWQKEADLLFQESGLRKSSSIVLFPYVQSMSGPTDMGYWTTLASKLKTSGYDVCTSISGSEKPIAGTLGIMIPFRALIPFCEQAGCIIALRSGIADILSTARCEKIVIYTDQFFVNFYGLEKMGLTSEATELIFPLAGEGQYKDHEDFSDFILSKKK